MARTVIGSQPRQDEEAEVQALLEAVIREQAQIIEANQHAFDAKANLTEIRHLASELEFHNRTISTVGKASVKLASLHSGIERVAGQLAEGRLHSAASNELMGKLEQALAALPRFGAIPVSQTAAPAEPLLSSFVEPFFIRRRNTDDTTHQVISQERGTLTRFIEAIGDRPAETYTRGNITGFLGLLRRLPKTYGKSPKDKELTLSDLIKRADATSAERLKDKTVKRHLSTLSQFFAFIVDSGSITTEARNQLVDDHRFRTVRTSARDQRDAWTSADLKTLFSSPLWTGCHPYFRSEQGTEIIRDAKFWLPLLALFHGARLEEFADLYGRDIILGSLPAIQIQVTLETEAKKGRRLKTTNAARTIPIHPEIIRMGFLQYVATTAPTEDDALFPDLAPQGKDGKRGPRVTRWFAEYRKALGVYQAGVAMHAFRHTAITRLNDVVTDIQQKRHIDYIMGHAPVGSEGSTRYDKGPGFSASANSLSQLRYPELDFSHLYL